LGRFLFNLSWGLAVTLLAGLVPLTAFFTLHQSQSMGSAAPVIISMGILFLIIAVQAFIHLHLLDQRYPERKHNNVWTTLIVTGLALLTLPVILFALTFWASSHV
jgi:hypothetical protein